MKHCNEFMRKKEEILSALRAEMVSPVSDVYCKNWALFAKLGLLGMSISCDYGGLGFDILQSSELMQEVGKLSVNTSLMFATGAHQFACSVPLFLYGNEILKKDILPLLCHGQYIGANAMTESHGGTDVNALRTSATFDGQHYILSGEKSYVTNAPHANVFIVYARTDPAAGFLGISAFLVEKETFGFELIDSFQPKGMRQISIASLRFNQCKILPKYLLGAEGGGLKIFHESMFWERTCMFSGFLGYLDVELERLIQFVKNRKIGNKSIMQHQAVTHKVANMKLCLESSKLLIQKACEHYPLDQQSALYSALAKLSASETYVHFALESSKIYAGAGSNSQHISSQYLNDAVLSTIFSGTSDAMREIIARELLI